MPTCDMCGKETELFKAKIEGTILDVCKSCSRFGEVIRRVEQSPQKEEKKPVLIQKRKEIMQLITDDCAEKIRKARERIGLTQEEFAKRLNEKESIIQKMEAGQFKPSIITARKLEKILRITIIESHEEGNIPLQTRKDAASAFTIGDFIKTRKNKKS